MRGGPEGNRAPPPPSPEGPGVWRERGSPGGWAAAALAVAPQKRCFWGCQAHPVALAEGGSSGANPGCEANPSHEANHKREANPGREADPSNEANPGREANPNREVNPRHEANPNREANPGCGAKASARPQSPPGWPASRNGTFAWHRGQAGSGVSKGVFGEMRVSTLFPGGLQWSRMRNMAGTSPAIKAGLLSSRGGAWK